MRRFILTILIGFAANAFAQSFHTTVQPQPKEDLAQSCHYELTLAAEKQKVRGVWVIYDRGPQITSFYSDPDVAALARRNHLALLLAHQCNSINAPGGPAEMDMDPSHGIGRALFTALDQFAQQSNHPELSSSKLVLLGFSGTGALFAHFVEYAPNRVIAAVLVHPAHYEPMALDSVELTADGLKVPELIFAGGIDKIATTQTPYKYFLRYRQRGAPWTFVVQNNADHFRVSPTKPLILGWIDAVLSLRRPRMNEPLRTVDAKGPWAAYIARCSSNEQVAPTWKVCRAAIEKVHSPNIANMLPAGWLPSKQVAALWLQTAKQDDGEASRH